MGEIIFIGYEDVDCGRARVMEVLRLCGGLPVLSMRR